MTRSLGALFLSLAAAAALPAQAAPASQSAPASQAALRAAPSGFAVTEVQLAPARSMGMGMDNTPPKTIRIEYGQPHLRGRALHTDSLVPYDKPWRTGANANTTIKTDVDLFIGGVTLPKGTYFMYTIPSRTAWKLVIQRDAGQSAMSFDDKHDVARIDLAHKTLSTPVESLTMVLQPTPGTSPAAGILRISWGLFEVSTFWIVK